jgi:hypothetical protein
MERVSGKFEPVLPKDDFFPFARALFERLGISVSFGPPETRLETPYGCEYERTIWKSPPYVVELLHVICENPENCHDGGPASHYRASIQPLPGNAVVTFEGYMVPNDLTHFYINAETIDPRLPELIQLAALKHD